MTVGKLAVEMGAEAFVEGVAGEAAGEMLALWRHADGGSDTLQAGGGTAEYRMLFGGPGAPGK